MKISRNWKAAVIPLPDIKEKAEEAFPEILKAATEWKSVAKLPPLKAVHPAGRLQFCVSLLDTSDSPLHPLILILNGRR